MEEVRDVKIWVKIETNKRTISWTQEELSQDQIDEVLQAVGFDSV